MLEQLAVTERHRSWVDNVAQLFGGLDICAIELLVGKDGKEYIIEVNDSALSLMGDSQEEDRRHIADLVTAKMQVNRLEFFSTLAVARPERSPLSGSLLLFLLKLLRNFLKSKLSLFPRSGTWL